MISSNQVSIQFHSKLLDKRQTPKSFGKKLSSGIKMNNKSNIKIRSTNPNVKKQKGQTDIRYSEVLNSIFLGRCSTVHRLIRYSKSGN